VVLDLAMPITSGQAVLRALRDKFYKQRVLIFTGVASDKLFELHDDYSILLKPAGVTELLGAVRTALDEGGQFSKQA
jgi:DNA-binding NarL/FixJ family response regulator